MQIFFIYRKIASISNINRIIIYIMIKINRSIEMHSQYCFESFTLSLDVIDPIGHVENVDIYTLVIVGGCIR